MSFIVTDKKTNSRFLRYLYATHVKEYSLGKALRSAKKKLSGPPSLLLYTKVLT